MFSTVFLGTEKFAEYILKAMITSGLFDIKLVITQPDRPVGRLQELQKSPVKILAEKYAIPIAQPASLKNYNWPLDDYDLNIVVEYGLIIPKKIIELPKYKTINVHPSLLPKYRGASPIQSALLDGEKVTGVSIMLIDEKLDHGPILAQEKLVIDNNDNYADLAQKLAGLSADLLIKTVPDYLKQKIQPVVQNDETATFCKIFKKEDGLINFNRSAEEIYNRARGLSEWPGIYTLWNGKRLKLLDIKPVPKTLAAGQVAVMDQAIFIGCKENSLEILKLQLEGKKAMTAKEFINGYKNIDGYVF